MAKKRVVKSLAKRVATKSKAGKKKTTKAAKSKRSKIIGKKKPPGKKSVAGVNRRRRLSSWGAASMTTAIDKVWDQAVATGMLNCEPTTTRPNRDCNCFVKNAARGFFSAAQAFDKPNLDADGIIGVLSDSANGWTEIADTGGDGATRTAGAITAFNTDNKVVIAGMTADDLGDDHGHLALVVAGTEFAGTANLKVPKCTAGSIGNGRVKDSGVNNSFGKDFPRQIRYFWRRPDTTAP